MGQPVVHFEVIGQEPAKLRNYFSELFGWEFDTEAQVAPDVSEEGNYGFISQDDDVDGPGIPGGVGGGRGFAGRAMFYVGVEDVEEALASAERLGGTREMGPVANPNGKVVVGHFRDPEGNLIGVAGPK